MKQTADEVRHHRVVCDAWPVGAGSFDTLDSTPCHGS